MKKVLCVVAALVMCLGLTGCSSNKIKFEGDWCALNLRTLEELLPERPTQLSDLPEELQNVSKWATVTFRDVNPKTTIVEITDFSVTKLIFLCQQDSGEWKVYEQGSYWTLLRFGDDNKGREFVRGESYNEHGIAYSFSENWLSVTFLFTGKTSSGSLTKWDDNMIFWTSGDGENKYNDLLIPRDTLLDDELRLK